MRLVIGGACQGKRRAACRLFGYLPEDFLDGKSCSFSDALVCPAIYDFQELIRRGMQEGYPLEEFAEDLIRQNPEILIVSDEVGYGVVPVDARERAFREMTGRLCCRLAEEAETVVRVLAGVPMAIKGELP